VTHGDRPAFQATLSDLYDSEINAAISWNSLRRFQAVLGNPQLAKTRRSLLTFRDAVLWLRDAACQHLPDSSFAQKYGASAARRQRQTPPAKTQLLLVKRAGIAIPSASAVNLMRAGEKWVVSRCARPRAIIRGIRAVRLIGGAGSGMVDNRPRSLPTARCRPADIPHRRCLSISVPSRHRRSGGEQPPPARCRPG
jgi:hypothetical protein